MPRRRPRLARHRSVYRGARVAEQRLDHEYKLAKRVIKNQRGFMKDVVHAMAPPHGTTHAARKAPVKSAA